MSEWLQKAWYQPSVNPLLWLLLPFNLMFAILSYARRRLYKYGIKASYQIDCPVIVVGNISVGGNGKTPLVIALANYLKQQGFNPGVLSRGYGGKSTTYPHVVTQDAIAKQVGDEPAMMKRRLSCPLVIDPDRVRGANHLVDTCNVNVIICDDGLQHYRLQREIEIAVVDGARRLGNQQLLPMGPLREGPNRLSSVDYVVVNGDQAGPDEILMGLVPGQLVNIKHPSRTSGAHQLQAASISAVAGIGNPQRFFDTLKRQGISVTSQLAFPDHHQFDPSDIPEHTVIMTEKDAIKCCEFASDDWWYLPVTAQLPEQFLTSLITKLKQL